MKCLRKLCNEAGVETWKVAKNFELPEAVLGELFERNVSQAALDALENAIERAKKDDVRKLTRPANDGEPFRVEITKSRNSESARKAELLCSACNARIYRTISGLRAGNADEMLLVRAAADLPNFCWKCGRKIDKFVDTEMRSQWNREFGGLDK